MNHIFHFKSYLKFLSRNKAYTFINVFGLSVSLLFVILIGIYIQQEKSVDRMHSKAERIVALGCGVKGEMYQASHHNIQPKLLSRYPEIESTCGVAIGAMMVNSPVADKFVAKTLFVDSTFYKLFDFQLVEGDRNTALREKNSVVLTEELAKTLFGDTDPLGKAITVNDSTHLIVTGVTQKVENSIFPESDMITHFENIKYFNLSMLGDGMTNATGASVFILLKPNCELFSKTKDMLQYFKTFFWFYQMKNCADQVYLFPLNKLYFSKGYSCCGVTRRGDQKLVNILFGVGLIILLFSMMNYINLTVAQSGFRSREMAVRRLMGSHRKDIILRLILESMLLCLLSLAIALLLASALAPSAGHILNTKLLMNNLLQPLDITILVCFVLIIGMLAGIFPAVVISAAKPIEIVRGTFRRRTKMMYSKLFITFQNTITIVLIAVSLTMILQLHHLIKAPLGYDTNRLMLISDEGDSIQSSTFANELKQLSCVQKVSACKGVPYDKGNNFTLQYQNKTISFQELIGDSAYFDILGLKLKQIYHTSNTEKLYVNSQALSEEGLKADSRTIYYGKDVPIDGVVQDFHCGDITSKQCPIVLKIEKTVSDPWQFIIKVDGDMVEAYHQVQRAYKKAFKMDLDEEHPYIDQLIEENFESMAQVSKIISLFAFIAVLISLLGLIGMSTYFIQQRKREIAVRKVFGSTNAQILNKLVKTFLSYVVIAFVIAVPIIYYTMSGWLSDFSYRISLSPLIYIAAGVFCLLVSFVAVFIQSYQASTEDPARSIQEN